MYSESALPLPWGIDESIIVYVLFSPVRGNLALTVEEATTLFKELQMLRQGSDAAQPTVRAISKHPLTMPIDKAIICALGPIIGRIWDLPDETGTMDHVAWLEWKELVLKAMMQLIWFPGAVDELARHQGTPREAIKVYGQDPFWSERDEQFLRGLGIEILHLPEAETLTDFKTFVYAPRIIYAQANNALTRCIRHQPALYAGNGIDAQIRNLLDCQALTRSKEGVERDKRQLQAYKSTRRFFDAATLGTFLEQVAYEDIKIHVRTTAPTEGELHQACTSSCSWVPKFKPWWKVKF